MIGATSCLVGAWCSACLTVTFRVRLREVQIERGFSGPSFWGQEVRHYGFDTDTYVGWRTRKWGQTVVINPTHTIRWEKSVCVRVCVCVLANEWCWQSWWKAIERWQWLTVFAVFFLHRRNQCQKYAPIRPTHRHHPLVISGGGNGSVNWGIMFDFISIH